MLGFGDILLYVASYFGLFTSIFFIFTLVENWNNLSAPKLPKKLPKVSIMVPACNEEFTLSKTVKSLLELDWPKTKLEILIIDDGSVDKTYEIAQEWAKTDPRVRAFTKPNGGKGTALNFALDYVTGEVVGCLDADSFVEPDCLKKMIGFFNNPKVGAVTPSLKCTIPKTLWQRIQVIEFLLGVYLRKVFSFLGSIHVTPGPFTLFKKSFFDKYGGYDESTVTEDIEISLRLQTHDYIIENAVDANVYAVAMPTFLTMRKQRVRWYRGFLDNMLNYKHLFSAKYGNLGLFILPSAFFSVILAMVVTGYAIFNFTDMWISRFINLYNVNFDIWKLKWFQTDLFYMNQSAMLWIGLLSLAIGIAVMIIVKQMSSEKQNIAGNYVLFIALYLPLFSYWWLESLYCKATKGDVVWRGRKREDIEIENTVLRG
ncbi:glycosyltransferase family 2 protein [Candidatus Woesearchaeota archaeon]|jgi:cellulose synthase/poly-beta-1,6-N-acetylglucosamine synthase-like glycosyltransferase|nr:glycosyltransferase family 2 protein [Candidatus Woesearchaeota archaeon]